MEEKKANCEFVQEEQALVETAAPETHSDSAVAVAVEEE